MTEGQVRKRVKYWGEKMGLGDLKISVRFINDPDSEVAGMAAPEPQYRRGMVKFNLGVVDFERDSDAHIRHELAHLMVSMYTQVVGHLVEDEGVKKVLGDLEDELVTRISEMPLFDHLG